MAFFSGLAMSRREFIPQGINRLFIVLTVHVIRHQYYNLIWGNSLIWEKSLL